MAKYYILNGQVLRIKWQSNIVILCEGIFNDSNKAIGKDCQKSESTKYVVHSNANRLR